MRIGLITYNRPHRKTWDLASRLYLEDFDVVLLYVPWQEYKERHPLVIHRPDQDLAPDPNYFAKKYGWTVKHYDKVDNVDLKIIGGGRYIPGLEALNSHPGYLPYTRGLDSLKWAIYNSLPIGVSVHWTSDELDGGRIVYHKLIPLYFEDTFHSLAYRVYEAEVQALIDVVKSPNLWDNDIRDNSDQVIGILHKRMPPFKETIMLEKFETRRKNAPSIYE